MLIKVASTIILRCDAQIFFDHFSKHWLWVNYSLHNPNNSYTNCDSVNNPVIAYASCNAYPTPDGNNQW